MKLNPRYLASLLALLSPLTLAPSCPQASEDPEGLYTILCAACHGQGQAAIGPYPPLFGNATLASGGPLYVAVKALRGSGNMFPLCGLASNEELTLLANHLARINDSPAPAISLEEVAALRPPPDECPDIEY